jgi:predicted nucleic acid-binding protein
VDANVVIATVLNESATPAARQFWQELTREDSVIAPAILFPECTSALRQRTLDGTISEAEGVVLLEEMLALPIAIELAREQFPVALAWAIQMKRKKTNDLQYVAIASIREAQILTLDSGVRQAALEHGVPVTVIR